MMPMPRPNTFSSESGHLFGSMLSDVEYLGDVDVAVELEAKVSDGAVFQEWSMSGRHEAEAGGKSFRTVVDWLYGPYKKFLTT